jgi:rhodanese-related sulfurtransferase
MKKRVIWFGCVAVAIAVIVGLASRHTPAQTSVGIAQAAPRPISLAEEHRVSPAELSRLAGRGEVLILDVRDAEAYLASHIEGALHIPLSYIESEIPHLRRGKTIITYCACPAEETSGRAALVLRSGGIEASALTGGIDAWTLAGLPVKSGRG